MPDLGYAHVSHDQLHLSWLRLVAHGFLRTCASRDLLLRGLTRQHINLSLRIPRSGKNTQGKISFQLQKINERQHLYYYNIEYLLIYVYIKNNNQKIFIFKNILIKNVEKLLLFFIVLKLFFMELIC